MITRNVMSASLNKLMYCLKLFSSTVINCIIIVIFYSKLLFDLQEAKLKENKRKKKEQLKKIENEESQIQPSKDREMDFLRTPRCTRNFGPLSDSLTTTDVSDGGRTTDDSVTPRSSRLLPPIQEPLGTKFVQEESSVKKKKKKKSKRETKETDVMNRENVTESQKTMQSVSNIEISTRSLNENREKEPEDQQLSGHGKYYTTEDIVDGGVSPREKKSKKKKARHVGSNGYVLQDLSNPMETEESLNSSGDFSVSCHYSKY